MTVVIFKLGKNRVRLIVILAVIILVYVPSRLYLLLCTNPVGSDAELYARYAYIHRLAAEKGVSFNDLYRTMGLDEIRQKGVHWFDSTSLTVVCYPALAVAVVEIPSLFIGEGRKVSQMSLDDFTIRYHAIYRRLCALFEMIAVVMVSLLIASLYKNEDIITTMFRTGILSLSGFCMPSLLYDRLDIILSALLAVSLVVLLKKKPVVSFFIFACAIAYKIVPLFLLPIWVLGSFKGSDFQQVSFKKRVVNLLRQGCMRGLFLGAMVAGIFLVFYCIEGKGSFDFIGIHSNRGIHLESTWGTLSLLTARLAGSPYRIVNGNGSLEVVMPATPGMLALSVPLLIFFLLGLAMLLVFRCVKTLERPIPKDFTLLRPQSIIEATLLFLCVVFSVSRIFSPQYLLLLVPLVALMPFTGRGASVFACIFVLCCCFSTLIYPYFFEFAIVKGPSWFGLYLLTTRTLLILGMAGFLMTRAIAAVKSKHYG